MLRIIIASFLVVVAAADCRSQTGAFGTLRSNQISETDDSLYRNIRIVSNPDTLRIEWDRTFGRLEIRVSTYTGFERYRYVFVDTEYGDVNMPLGRGMFVVYLVLGNAIPQHRLIFR